MIPRDVLATMTADQDVSQSELEVLELALSGKATGAIAKDLGISAEAVRKRLGEVYKKYKIGGIGPGKLAKLQSLLMKAYQRYQSLVPIDDAPNAGDDSEVAAAVHSAVVNLENPLDLTGFLGRARDLATLRDWVLGTKREAACRLVAVVGSGGAGKSYLVAKLADEVTPHFDFILERSLRHYERLETLLANLNPVLAEATGAALPSAANEDLSGAIATLLEFFRRYRCLLILDDLDQVLESGKLAGRYRREHQAYATLLQQVVSRDHRSSLIVISTEKPNDLSELEQNAPRYVRTLSLDGFNETDASTFLKARGLSEPGPARSKLIQHYGGNPLALKIAAATIQDLFGGDPSVFLDQGASIFGGIQTLLDQQFERLSLLEQEILYWLAINREMAFSDLQDDVLTSVSLSDLLDALESLGRRSLIEKTTPAPEEPSRRRPERTGIRFSLQPVVQQYVIERLIHQVCDEIIAGKPDLFERHALLKADAKEFIRDYQIQAILKPVKERLLSRLGTAQALRQQVEQLLDRLRQSPTPKTGYAAGNVLNLLGHLDLDADLDCLNGMDFSGLTIRQAYAMGLYLRRVNFAQASFIKPVFTESFGNVLAIAFNPTGQLLATGDADGELRTWEITTTDNEQKLTYRGHTSWVYSVAFSPDGKWLASSSSDQTIRIWDPSKNLCLKVLTPSPTWVRCVAFSPDSKWLASSSDDHHIYIWEVATWRLVGTLTGHQGIVRAIAFAPGSVDDPERVVLASASDDHTVRLWNVTTGDALMSLRGHSEWVYAVAFSPDGQTLVSGSEDQTVRLWDRVTGQCRHILSEHRAGVRSVSVSPDGSLVASGSEDQTVRLWNMATGECHHTLEGHRGRVWSVAFRPDGAILASGSEDQLVKFWDVAEGKSVQTLQGYTRGVRSVAFGSDSTVLVSSGEDRIVRVWDVPTKQPKRLRGHTGRVWSVALSPNGQMIASGSDDRTVRLWDRRTGECLQSLPEHTNWVRTVAFKPDGSMLASGSDDCTVRLWDVVTGKGLHCLKGHDDWVWAIAFHPTDPLLASASGDRTVRLWDVETGACLDTLTAHPKPLRAVAFNRDGSLLASAGDDPYIRLWDVKTRTLIKTLEAHLGWVRSVAFSPTQDLLASGGGDDRVKLWAVSELLRTDATKDDPIAVLEGHTRRIRSVAFSADGHALASGSKDETIRVWNLTDLTRLTKDTALVLRTQRPYEAMNIYGVTGLTDAQKATLRTLGAVEIAPDSP